MKIGKNNIQLFILLFAVSSLLVHFPSEAFADLGDITAVRAQSLGNNFEYDDDTGRHNSLVQVDSDTYALAYRGADNDGFISTFNISSDGTTITEVETIEHDDDFAWDNSLIKVDSDTFALAYGGEQGGSAGRPQGMISTFTIDSDGDITPIRIQNHAAFVSASENLNHDTNEGSVNSLVHVNDDTYALSYERNGLQLGITTFTISSDGATITELDSLNNDADNCNDSKIQSLVKVDSDTVARAYCGSGGDGFLRTFSIAENGDITKKSTYEFDTSGGSEHFLVQVDSDTIAVAYENEEVSGGMVTERNGVIKTFTINSSDEISEADSLEHHSGNTPSTGNAEDNFLVRVDSDIFALAYDDGIGGNDGFISTFRIDSDGNITGLSTANQGNNLEHDTSFSSNRSLVKVDSNTVALAYGGTDNVGFISTFTISVTNTEEKSSKGGGCNTCIAPTMGIANGPHIKRIVEDGFTLNGKSFDVMAFKQTEELIYTETGITNNITLKIYEDRGPENIRYVAVFLGLDDTDIYRNLASIIWENDWDGKKTVTVVDEHNLFEDEFVLHGIFDNHLILNYSFVELFPIPESTIGVEIRDGQRNKERNYFENILEVTGPPLIPNTGIIQKNNTIENFITDTYTKDFDFTLELDDSQNRTISDFDTDSVYEIPANAIVDTSKIGFSDKLTKKYLDRIEQSVRQNDLELLSQNKVDAPQEQTPPKVDQTTLQILQEQQKAKIILDEILGKDIDNWDTMILEIPSWIRQNAGWWSDGSISDRDFILGIQFLIDEKIIQIHLDPQDFEIDSEIPDWIKQNAEWWSEGLISDRDFVLGIENLLNSEIISVR